MYAVKYMGVTDGQIGVLTTKVPLPRLSGHDRIRASLDVGRENFENSAVRTQM
jgi:hypothetical protein